MISGIIMVRTFFTSLKSRFGCHVGIETVGNGAQAVFGGGNELIGRGVKAYRSASCGNQIENNGIGCRVGSGCDPGVEEGDAAAEPGKIHPDG